MNSSILIVGASSGIGKHTSLEFAKNNWRVIAASRNVKLLNTLSLISQKKKYKKIETSKLDITDERTLKKKTGRDNKKVWYSKNSFSKCRN